MDIFISDFLLKSILIDDAATFHHNNQSSESQIDHIYNYIPRSSNMKVEFHEQLCLKENPSNLSSHDVIVGNLTYLATQTSKPTEDMSKSYSEFPVKRIKWHESGMDGYQSQTAQILQDIFDRFNMVEHVPLLFEMCSRMLVISAEQNFETS